MFFFGGVYILVGRKSSPNGKRNPTILFDLFIPVMCSFCETSPERYNRFLAFRGLNTLLEQIISFIREQKLTDISPEQMKKLITTVLDLIWCNWTDSFESIVTEVNLSLI